MITLPAAIRRSGVKLLLWIQDICIMSKYIYVCVCEKLFFEWQTIASLLRVCFNYITCCSVYISRGMYSLWPCSPLCLPML